MGLQVLRSRTNAATGETPSAIILGYEIPVPGEWQSQFSKRRKLLTPQERRRKNQIVVEIQLKYQAKVYPEQKCSPKITFKVGDRVNIRSHKPGFFAPAWRGPGIVTKVLSETTYEIELEGCTTISHIDDLRPSKIGNQIDFKYTLDDQSVSVSIPAALSCQENSNVEWGCRHVEDFRRVESTTIEVISDKEKTAGRQGKMPNVAQVTSDEHAWKQIELDVASIVTAMEHETKPNRSSFLKYDEEVTCVILKMDSISNRENVRFRRKYVISLLEVALDNFKSKIVGFFGNVNDVN